MDVYSGQLQGAIIFLQEIIKETDDPALKKYLLLRKDSLKKMFLLEQSIAKFEKKFGNKPLKLEELLNTGILVRLPEDPYGGTFLFEKTAGFIQHLNLCV